jgi:hypothetical protein
MATINYSIEQNLAAGYTKVEWAGMATGDVGQVFDCAGLRIACVHQSATLSGNVNIYASNQITPTDFGLILQMNETSPRTPDQKEVGAVKPIITGTGTGITVAILFKV